MTLLIDLSEPLEDKVKAEAKKRHRIPEDLIIDIVTKAFEDDFAPTVREVVDRIKAMPPNPAMATQPQGSLAEALRNGPTDPDFDLDAWNQEWAAADEELKLIDQVDELVTRRQTAMALLQSWINEGDDEEQQATGAYILRVLDEDRLSNRELFPQEFQGITW